MRKKTNKSRLPYFALGIFILIELIVLFGKDSINKISIQRNQIPATFTSSDIKKCGGYKTISQKQQCWDNLIVQTLEKQGLSKAFELFNILFSADKEFAADCHGYTHTLGKYAYRLYAKGIDIELTRTTSYCGYGFYHGFMEELIHKSGKIADAREFCFEAGRKLQRTTTDASGACFHGIGHGFVADTPDPSKWGNPDAIIKPGLEICEKIADNDMNLYRCTSGVFNAIEILMDAKKYKLHPDETDPFSLCKRQPDKYKKSCYTQMASSLLQLKKNDFNKAVLYIDTIKEDEYAIPTFTSTNVERIRLGLTDYNSTVKYCRTLPERFHIPCVTSFAEGFLKYGPPEKEYVKAMEFCNTSLLTLYEKRMCFTHITSLFRIWYTKEKSLSLCQSVNPLYLNRSCNSIY